MTERWPPAPDGCRRPSACRTSSWCSTSGASTSPRCPASRSGPATGAFPFVRRQEPEIPGRGRRGAELVHRIQRADRAVGAHLRRFADSSPASPPAGSSAACRMRCAAAATAPSASILWGCVHRRAAFQNTTGSTISSTPRTSARAARARRILLRCGRRPDRARARRRRCSCSATRSPIISRGTSASGRISRRAGKRPGNALEVDEYLRRQEISARDYSGFVARLKREFPGEPFLIVRFGDHQPKFAKHMVDPSLDKPSIARRIAEATRGFSRPITPSTAELPPGGPVVGARPLDAPTCRWSSWRPRACRSIPLREQKRILGRCNGLFYPCASGAEARRFNRLLIDAGLIKRL